MKTLRPLLLAVPAFLLACGAGTTPDVSAGSQAGLKSDVVSGWVDYYFPVSPDPFPPVGVPCFGHAFTFYGVFHAQQQTITAGDGKVRYVLRGTYEPPAGTSGPAVFIEIPPPPQPPETGAPWVLLTNGQAHPGIEVTSADGTTYLQIEEMDKIPLLNQATSERLTIWGKWHLATTAAGEVKFGRFGIYCTEP